MVVLLSSCLVTIPYEFIDNPNTSVVISPLLAEEIREQGEIREGNGDPVHWLTALRELMESLNLSSGYYHNAQHAQSVHGRMMLIEECSAFEFPSGLLWVLAALGHDLHYSGSMYRQLLVGIDHPELSNEEYACLIMDQLVARALSPADRLRLQGMILATSFGQRPEDGCAADLVRPYKPYSPAERSLAFADVGSVAMGTAEDWLRDCIRLAAERGARTERDYWGFVCSNSQKHFFDHVKHQLEGLRPYIIPNAYDDWLHNLTMRSQELVEIQTAYQRTQWSLGLLRPRGNYLFEFLSALIKMSVWGGSVVGR
jgi:hypothetical protein